MIATNEVIGKRVKALRVHNRLTQAELAKRSKVSLSTVSRIEGGSEASLDSLRSLAEALGLGVEEIIGPEEAGR